MALTQEQMRHLLTERIAMRMRELVDFSLIYPGTWGELQGEFDFLKDRMSELQGKKMTRQEAIDFLASDRKEMP